MDGAFFVGRKEIMDWVNSTLDLNLAKIEDTASGAAACQLLDIMYPGQVPMHKVNWGAKTSVEFTANYKVLQDCFTKLHIERHIDVGRLIGGRYMDNLEFMQWFKRFFELSCSGRPDDYDPISVRTKGKGSSSVDTVKKIVNNKPATAPASTKQTVTNNKPANVQKENKAPAAKPTISTTASTTNVVASKVSPAKPSSAVNVDAYKQEIELLKNANTIASQNFEALKAEVVGVEKERDFYFEKLRDIEVILQEVEDNGNGNDLTASIFKILYATADGFAPAVNAEDSEAISVNNVETAEIESY